MPRKKVVFHRGNVYSDNPRGRNAFSRESARLAKEFMHPRGPRYELRAFLSLRRRPDRFTQLEVIRNPRMKPLIYQGGKA